MNSFEEAILKQNTFGEVCTAINNLILLAEKYPQITNCIDYPNEKKESNFVEYQHKESIVERVLFRDRSHPIDTVMLNDFNRKSGTDIETVKLEYGPSANEYTRSHHALAIAVANTIYFRNGAYKPETEEGRKLIIHELKHIAQNKDKENYRNVSKDEKEKEAEIAEKNEEYKSDRLIMRKIKGKEYLFKESIWKMIDYEAKQKLEEKIESLENCLAEEEYLRLLINYREWGKE